jgi:hypothetical protein
MSIDDYLDELRAFIASDETLPHKDVLCTVFPLVKENLEFQKRQYGQERTGTIVIPRRAKQALVSSTQEGRSQTYGNKEGGNRSIEAESRDARAEGLDKSKAGRGKRGEENPSGNIHGLWDKYTVPGRGSILTDTRYSLSYMPFFEDEGEVVMFNEGDAPLSENIVYVAPKRTEERMMELLEPTR